MTKEEEDMKIEENKNEEENTKTEENKKVEEESVNEPETNRSSEGAGKSCFEFILVSFCQLLMFYLKQKKGSQKKCKYNFA